jgi:TPR repeat protein
MKRIISLFAMLLVASFSVNAQQTAEISACVDVDKQIYDGRKLQEKGEFDKAFALFSQACQCGDSHGCARLGYLYESGEGVAQDYLKAKSLFEEASKTDGRGYNGLGNMYYWGSEGEQDFKKAALAYELGCMTDKGYAVACSNLGAMYRDGEGVGRNMKKAAELFTRACHADEHGDESSSIGCLNLGVMYHNNWGVKRDIIKAINYYETACSAEFFSDIACQNLGDQYIDYGNSGKKIFPDDPRLAIKKDRMTALKYYKKACDAGTSKRAYGCGPLGLIYLQPNDPRIPKDIVKAAALLHKGCDGTTYVDSRACVNLAFLYLYNHKPLIEQNFEKGVALFQRACDHGSSTGCQNLASLYLEGSVVKKDASKAKQYYYKSCQLGNKGICNYIKKHQKFWDSVPD